MVMHQVVALNIVFAVLCACVDKQYNGYGYKEHKYSAAKCIEVNPVPYHMVGRNNRVKRDCQNHAENNENDPGSDKLNQFFVKCFFFLIRIKVFLCMDISFQNNFSVGRKQ